MPDELLSIDEVAAYLKIPLKTVYDWRRLDKGPPALRVGKYLRYRRSDLEAWLSDQGTSRLVERPPR